MKILVSAFSNLTTDQRIEKVCDTLHKNAYEIELIGNDWGGNEKINRDYTFHRISITSKTLKFAYLEFQYKLYREIQKRIDGCDILLTNDLDALLPNYMLSKKHHIPLVFDSHEIFTEMPSLQGRWTKKIWKSLEKKLLPNIKYMMTESQSYADWFSQTYGNQPVVIRNVPKKLNFVETPTNEKKIILYQGVINPYRGIEKAILAMKLIENAVFYIVGDGRKRLEYEQLVSEENLEEKVLFLGKKTPNELREITKIADVGLSIEENGGLSYLYSLPNKVSDYVQARIPVVMINFPEMKKIYEQFHIGEMIINHESETIAKAIKKVLSNNKKYYLPELERAADELCWENEETKILNLIQKASQNKIYIKT